MGSYMPGLHTAEQVQHGTGHGAEVYRGGNDHIVEVISINHIHPIVYHALGCFPAATAVDAGCNARIEGRDFDDFSFQMGLQFLNQRNGIAVWAGGAIQ